MVGKQGTAGAGVEGKRSSRLAAKEEACVVDSRKRGRASTGEDKKSSPAAVQPPPSKRGKAEQTAPAPEKAKNRSQPAATPATPAAAASPSVPVPAKQAVVPGAGASAASNVAAQGAAPAVTAAPPGATAPPAVAAPAAAAVNAVASTAKPSPSLVPAAALPARSSERRDSSQGLGGVLAAAQARKEASFSSASVAPQRAPNPAAATRKANAAAAAAGSPSLQPAMPTMPQQQQIQQSPQQQLPQQQSPTSVPRLQRTQPSVQASVAQQKAAAPAYTGPPKDNKPAAVTRGATGVVKPKSKDTPPPSAAAGGAIPKIVIKQGGQAVAATEKRAATAPPVPLTSAQEAATAELRKGLWQALERWLAARAMLPGDGQDKFKSEIKRLCSQIVFDEFKQTVHPDQHHLFDSQLSAEFDCGSMRRETTYTRFGFRVPAHHPRPPPPMLFESTTYIFSADSVMGKTQKGIKDLRWKTEVELAGVLSITFHTQSMEIYEDIELEVLEQLKNTLNTELTLSELAVLLIVAGLCCRGAAAWVDVQDLCFWSNNLTLPELQPAQAV